MVYRKPMSFREDPAPPPLRLTRFLGIDQSQSSTEIDLTKSPDMLNVRISQNGKPQKRNGYAKAFTTSLGAGKINGMWYGEINNTPYFLFAWNTGLYRHIEGQEPTLIYNSLANSKVRFFMMQEKLYIKDNANYLSFDGTTVANVETNAYIPTLTMGRGKDGGGQPFEKLNLLTPKFKDSFSPDGTSTTYPMSLTNLDITALVGSLDGGVTFNQIEGTHFTVDRVTGLTTWSVAPPQGTDTLVIQASKTNAGFADRIKKCTKYMLYGGKNDFRVFMYGNPEYKNYRFHSDIYRPDYFPEDQFVKVGSDSSAITDLTMINDTQLILKEKTTADPMNDVVVWYSRYDEATGKYPVYPQNSQIGCDAEDSVQIIKNNPVFLNKQQGVHSVSNSAVGVRDERGIDPISLEINPSLLAEPNLKDAVSIDYTALNEYWLCLNNKAYVFNYRANAWYLFSNIPASCLLEVDGILYFGSEGMIYKFLDDGLPGDYADDGTAIESYIDTKLMGFDAEQFYKIISDIIVNMDPDNQTSCELLIRSEKDDVWMSKQTFFQYLFNYSVVNYEHFSYLTSKLPQPGRNKTKEKKIIYLQIRLRNATIYESMAISSLMIQWQTQGLVK